MYRLIEFELTDKTSTNYFFTIKVETKSFWTGRKVITVIDAYRELDWPYCNNKIDGSFLYTKFLNIDSVITAILSKANPNFKVI